MGNSFKNKKSDKKNKNIQKYQIIERKIITINNNRNNIDIISNIIYINSLKSIFCLNNHKIICLSYPNFKRIFEYENYFKKNIYFLNYQSDSQKLFVSTKNETFIYLIKNSLFIKFSKISSSICDVYEISSNKIIILNSILYCSCLEFKNEKYSQIKSYKNKINSIQICPSKDKIIGITNTSVILIEIKTFQLISSFKINDSYIKNSKIFFLSDINFIILNIFSIKIMNIKYYKIIFEYQIRLPRCNYFFSKIGNKGDFMLSFMCNYFNPIICEYKNNSFNIISDISLDGGIDSILCVDDYIFSGDCNRINIYKYKLI